VARDPSAARPDAPKSGAEEKSGRSGRDDTLLRWGEWVGVTQEKPKSGPPQKDGPYKSKRNPRAQSRVTVPQVRGMEYEDSV
jgi:hypothetical protein